MNLFKQMNVQNQTLLFKHKFLSLQIVVPVIDGDSVVMDVFRPYDRLALKPANNTSLMDLNDFKSDVNAILERTLMKHEGSSLHYLDINSLTESVRQLIIEHIRIHNRLVIDDLYFYIDHIVFITGAVEQRLRSLRDLKEYPMLWEQIMSKTLPVFEDYLMVLDPLTLNLRKYKS